MTAAATASPRRPRIYLAGPDVFRPDAPARFARLKAQCAALGLEGVAPTDTQVDTHPGRGSDDDTLAQRIYDGNIALLRQADGVAANLEAFRGLEPDSGTVFEVGYAIALGKPVVAYHVPAQSYAERVSAAMPCMCGADGVVRESATGMEVEGRGQRLNLMITRSCGLEATAEDALRQLARLLLNQ